MRLLFFNNRGSTVPSVRPGYLIASHLLQKMYLHLASRDSRNLAWGRIVTHILGGLTWGFRVLLAQTFLRLHDKVHLQLHRFKSTSYQVQQQQTQSAGFQVSQAYLSWPGSSYRRQDTEHLDKCQSSCTVIAVTILKTGSENWQTPHLSITLTQKESMQSFPSSFFIQSPSSAHCASGIPHPHPSLFTTFFLFLS